MPEAEYDHAHLTPDPVPHSGEPSQPAASKRFVIDLTPLKVSRDFRLLFSSQAVSFFGSMMSFVVLPVQMYQLTHSSFAVGMLGVTECVPLVMMALVGGAFADYFDRRRMVQVSELSLALCSAALMINSLLLKPHASVLYVCATAVAALSGIKRPSLQAMFPRLVASELIPAVSALNSLSGTLGNIVGPIAGGLVASSAGPMWAYGANLMTFVISFAALLMMRASPPPPDADRPSLQSIAAGLRYAKSRPELMGTYLVDMNAMFFGMPMALFPAIAAGFGNSSVGLLYAAPAAGALLATLTSGWMPRIQRHGLAVTVAAGLWGVAIVGLGYSGRLWLALVCLLLAGAADGVSGLFRMTIWNETIPDYLRGRLAGIEMISYLTGPLLGNAEAGIVASLFSIRASVVSGGVLCVLGTGLLALALPEFLTYTRREGLARKLREEAQRAAASREAVPSHSG
jgi:MFS family permease